MTARPVGVIGAYGAVGTATASALHLAGVGPLRLGGRHRARAEQLRRDVLGGHGEPVEVDVYSPSSLARFCEGCSVVVNCAGPSYQILERVALIAAATGADYVDAGGDDPLYERLRGCLPYLERLDRVAIVTAGMMPGLTGLLPRWLASTVTVPLRLTAYVGILDHLTPAGSIDYLLSLGSGFGQSQAAWRDGRRAPRALDVRHDVELPLFPGRVTAYPYLSTEAERLAADLGLVELSWFNVFDGGGRMLAALGRHQGAMVGEGGLHAAAEELARAADLDLFGRRPYQLMVFQLDGLRDGESVRVTASLRSQSTYEVTGTMVALATRAVVAGNVAPGVRFMAEALEAGPTIEALRETPVGQALRISEGSEADTVEVEEGVL